MDSEPGSPPGGSGAETEPLPSEDEAPKTNGKGKRKAASQVSVSGSRDALDGLDGRDGTAEEDEEPLTKEYGHTRPIKEIKARRRAAGSESSLTSQSDSESAGKPLASSSLKVPPRRAGLRRTASAAGRSDVSEASDADERPSTSPEIYKPRLGATAKSRRRRPPALDTGHLADESGASALPTPVSPPPERPTAAVNGRKRRRGEADTGRTLKAAKADKKRSSSPAVSRGKLKEPEIKVEEDPAPEEEHAVDEPMLEPEAAPATEEVGASQPITSLPQVEIDAGSEREEDEDGSQRARLEAMEELVRIEIKFSKVREALYLERAEANAQERQSIEDGTHPEMQEFAQFLDDKQSGRLTLARQMLINTERMVEHQIGVDERTAWRWWEASKLALRSELLLDTQQKRRRYDRDRTFGGKWDKAEESDKYREIYEDHMRRRALTEEAAENEYFADCEHRANANGVSPLAAPAIQADLQAMAIRTPPPSAALAFNPPMFAPQPSLGPYQQAMPPRMPNSGSAPAPYIAAASSPSVTYVPPPRTMPSPLGHVPYQSVPPMAQHEPPRSIASPPVVSQPASPAGAHRPGHASRPSLDAHMERKAGTPTPMANSRFALPPIPPFAGGTRTHSGMSASASAPATPIVSSAPVVPPPPPVSSSSLPTAPAQPMAIGKASPLPEIPAFRVAAAPSS